MLSPRAAPPVAAPARRHLRRTLLALVALGALALLPAPRAAFAQRYVRGEQPEFPKIKYSDSLVSVNDRCVVKQTKLSLQVRPVYVNWRPIGFCCAASPAIFLKEPEKYLKAQKTDLRCVVNPGGHATLDPTRRLYVNYEIFFFSTKGAMALFRRKTLTYCGWLTDPVSGARFKPTVGSPKMIFKGRPYYFSTISTRMKFEAMPDSFAVRKGM